MHAHLLQTTIRQFWKFHLPKLEVSSLVLTKGYRFLDKYDARIAMSDGQIDKRT